MECKCVECGIDFNIYPYQKYRKFCSLDCYKKHRKKDVKNISCIYCNKFFKVLNCHKNKKWCSDDCRISYKKEQREKNKIERNCKICLNKMFFYTKTETRQTCSEVCRHKLNGQRRKGIRWKMSEEGKKKISVGRKKFLVNPDNLKKHAEYTKESWKDEKTRESRLTEERAQKISQTGKRLYRLGIRKVPVINGVYSKPTKYNNILFRSTWEAKVAKWLDDNNIEWKYESKECIVELSNGSSYTIDFYLPNKNKYIEVKGYFDDYSIYKLDQATIKGYNIYIIDKTNINNIDLENDWFTQSKYFMEAYEHMLVGEV